MGALDPDEIGTALEAGAEVVAWTPEFVDQLPVHAPAGAPVRVHVKYDTGMGRLGTKDPGLVRALCERSTPTSALELCGLMTHFATADEPGDEHFPAQLARFTPLAQELKEQYPGLVVHAANSAATLREPAAHFDLVRCGIAVYGMDPFNNDPVAPRPRAGAVAALVRRVGEALRAAASRPATGGAGRRASRPGSASSRSATATAGGAP